MSPLAAHPPIALWREPPPGLEEAVEAAVARGLARAARPPEVFFRADDCGPVGRNFLAMAAIFARRAVPLSLAVVPVWLPLFGRRFRDVITAHRGLLSPHLHGFRHANHEPQGKKCEFGPARPFAAKRTDLERGLALLSRHLDSPPAPVFTPPWNRCDGETLAALKELGITVVSRFMGAKPPLPPGLAGADVNVDPHTLKGDAAEALSTYAFQLETALASGRAGIMLHHPRMTPAAFASLDRLIGLLAGAGCRFALPERLAAP